MELSLFQIVNFTLILTFLILFIRYIWIVYIGRDFHPVQWHVAVKNGGISSRLKRLERKYPDKIRFFHFWLQIDRLKREKIPGVFVEVGVYQGDSATIIHQMDPERKFHLFDTFSGFTMEDLDRETGEAATYTPDNFADTSMQMVLKKINDNDNIMIHQGYFPDSAAEFHEPVALAHIDTDLYKPTRAGLEFFYPRLSPGGVIMVHDYNYKWPGLIQAVDEFMKTIPEGLVRVPDKDGTVMIIRNK